MKIPVIDELLNKVTMYRITLYYLIFLVFIAIVLGLFRVLSYSPIDIFIETIIALSVCYVSNFTFAKIFKATTNFESVFISALILVLIIPVGFPDNLLFFIIASVLAMGVKYFLTINKRHILNPAAAALVAISLLSADFAATWWVGSAAMLPFVFFGGLLIVRKIRRERMVAVFLLVYILLIGITSFLHNGTIDSILLNWQRGIMSSAVFFFAFVMLTEPFTSPPTKKLQSIYSAIVGVLYCTPQIRLFGIIFTPEMALVLGNIFSYIVSPKYRLELKLKEKIVAANNTIVFNFGKVANFNFIPGQYLEWTLPHKGMDSRGNRRYFSLSSSVNEDIQIAVRFHDPASSYKKQMLAMRQGDKIIAASLAGDFVMPKNINVPLVFVAGGIGVAPFRSIIQHIIDNKLKVDIYMLYSNRSVDEIAFKEVFDQGYAYGVKIIYSLTDSKNLPQGWVGEIGHFDTNMLRRDIPDFKNRIFYVSGPSNMVQSMEKTLSELGISKRKIKTDYFPGYA